MKQQGGYLTEKEADFDEFLSIVNTPTDFSYYPHADRLSEGIVIFDAAKMPRATDPEARRTVMAEIAHALRNGPGVVVFEGGFHDHAVIDRASHFFAQVIDDQNRSGQVVGDHFAKPGTNDRIWNALEKFALLDPDGFVDYYVNDVIAIASGAWLGPGYQVTSQINVVNPGGQAQVPHRDYHLGFQSSDMIEQYPSHVHELSPLLTLQAGIAHVDMPLETGPTMFLPHSQKFLPGYLAWHREDIREHFLARKAQLPLAKGDVVFFNPAILHGAGTNATSDVKRMANLLQISSAFGRAMESVDRGAMTNAVYPSLVARQAQGMCAEDVTNILAIVADGYSFPTNLDRDPPIGGLAPLSQAQIAVQAFDQKWSPKQLADELISYANRRKS